MRIDFHYGPQATAESERSSAQKAAAADRAPSSEVLAPEDQTQLSNAHAQVQALSAQASHLPEVREERIEALRQAVQAGHYHCDPGRVAGSLVDQMILAT